MKTYYTHPYIITDHEVLYPTLTGTMTEIGWLEGDILELVITYNCLVSDGTREELILVVELPYFHDLEIHFFKTCGQQKQSIIKLSTLLYILGIGLVGYIAFYFYSQYKNEEKILDFTNLLESLKNFFGYFKTAFNNFRKKPAEDKNLESDDDGLNGLNVHTMYGTA